MSKAKGITQRLAFWRDESGAALVEYALVMSVFLFLLFGLIDFGRLGFSYVMAQKATERAVREAVVRTPVCAGVPTVNLRGPLDGEAAMYRFGASCSIEDGLCADSGEVTCTAQTAGPVSDGIWAEVSPLLPTNARRENLQFTYSFDSNLGFLGGPYTPVVTVQLTGLDFEFVTPLGALAAVAGVVSQPDVGSNFSFPSMSASLPAEILLDGAL